ncbi:GNAT family N-acetyltransferase [Clostridium sp. AL.422]|uniref:GNAT family N-acetyltransferase n=1 Tax=Clostridium TaxID=1485 RepID=UPI00293DD060|nr:MULTISPECIES: GNAT family N-acetyltransferase [unclassified Clostridium]MDV4152285.1 GNAT family N-acetyltransferase [Clostridium sp. AL.422]
MELNIKKINYKEAKEISKWIYNEPYTMYSMDGSDDCIDEILNEMYFSAFDKENNLIGYYCFGESAKVPTGNEFGVYDCKDSIDIGLGIKPILCGQGLGLKFLCEGINFAKNKLLAKRIRLTVASFNQRAIKVYKRAGFVKVHSFERIAEAGRTDFQVMIKELY